MRTVMKSLLAAVAVGFAVSADRTADAQLAFNVSVPIAQPTYYVDPFYPAAYQTYFGFYYPTYNYFPSTYYAYYYGSAVAPVASTSTYYAPSVYALPATGYPYSFGFPYSFGYAYPYGYGWNNYAYPAAYHLTYGAAANAVVPAAAVTPAAATTAMVAPGKAAVATAAAIAPANTLQGVGWPYTSYYGYGGHGIAANYYTGYYPTSYYGNYFPSAYGWGATYASYYGTGHYGQW